MLSTSKGSDHPRERHRTLMQRLEERIRAWNEERFLDNQPLAGGPSCSWASFRRPALRACQLPHEIHWEALLGHGVDGVVWKVGIDGHPYALKVFWDFAARGGNSYWAVQRECHNAALIQMIQTAIETSPHPICLNPGPATHRDAILNLRAFSDQGRCKPRFRELADAAVYSSTPRFRECFGWMAVTGSELRSLNRKMKPPQARCDGVWREISPVETYYAILYEYVPADALPPDMELRQSQLDLLWLAGFCITPMGPENWQGDLLDMADLISPWEPGWFTARYKRLAAPGNDAQDRKEDIGHGGSR